ncbi:MAG: GNAT family N-acetyltransferase [Clostridiales bacterium]|nr:GNAT family N-acetyltransferase [Clostridiales bacterium]
MDPISPVILETERLYAREFVKNDAADVFEYAGNIESSGFLPFSPESCEDVVKFVERRLAAQIEEPRKSYDLALCLKDTDEMIGAMGLYLTEDRRQAELGYLLKKRFWGNGYATEAGKAFLRFGFLGLELHRITARCDDKNAASYRVMEKLGMRREAHFIKDEYRKVFNRMGWRSSYHYAILQKEYLLSLPDGEYDPSAG